MGAVFPLADPSISGPPERPLSEKLRPVLVAPDEENWWKECLNVGMSLLVGMLFDLISDRFVSAAVEFLFDRFSWAPVVPIVEGPTGQQRQGLRETMTLGCANSSALREALRLLQELM